MVNCGGEGQCGPDTPGYLLGLAGIASADGPQIRQAVTANVGAKTNRLPQPRNLSALPRRRSWYREPDSLGGSLLFPNCFQHFRRDVDCLPNQIDDAGRAFWACAFVLWGASAARTPPRCVFVEQPDTIVYDYINVEG